MNVRGEEYERIEYTPYGEIWIDNASAASNLDIPYRFTGKERDTETGLYYYGARYLDSKTGRWLSTDPALAEYIPEAPVNDAARKRNGSLPGMGGVYNTINAHLYHYAGNNPVKYTDPDGKFAIPWPLVIKAAIEWVIPAIGAVFTTNALNNTIESLLNNILSAIATEHPENEAPSEHNEERAKDRRARERSQSIEDKHVESIWEEPASEDYVKNWRAKQVEKE